MKTFEQNIINLYGEKGRQWLEHLPNLLTQLESTYGLSNLKPVDNLTYNYVLSALQDSKPLILKLSLDFDELKREAAALTAFKGFGVAQVFAENSGLLLLECAAPGLSLKSYFPQNDNEAIKITANIIKFLHKAPIPSEQAFPHIKEMLVTLDKDMNIPIKHLQKARRLRDDLLKTSAKEVLLHGDLHQDNILQNGDDWLVIDPKGMIGEKAFEVAAFIRNPMPELLNTKNAEALIQNRIAHFATLLELPSKRIIDWCFVQAVLAWVWSIEDGCDTSYFNSLTEFFERY